MLSLVYRVLSSMHLTVILITFSILLVFLGTLEQVHIGIHEAQKKYFESFFVIWKYPPTWYASSVLFWLSIPLPGGFSLGGTLVLNLTISHFRYFKSSWKNLGISITHFGVLLLLISGFAVSFYQRESIMSIEKGKSKNYSESFYNHEIALIDKSDPMKDQVYSISSDSLESGNAISDPSLPLSIEIKQYHPHAVFGSREKNPNATSIKANRGLGAQQKLVFFPKQPSYAEDHINWPTAIVSLWDKDKKLGTWLISSFLDQGFPPQTFTHQGKTYQITLRSQRFYEPYEIYLDDIAHDKYPGTEIAKNFSSNIRIQNKDLGVNRKALVYMNHPLRYEGLTYYQHQMDSNKGVTVFQVVRNPSWLLPYLSVALVGVGLVLQFSSHLFRFGRRRKVL